MKAVVLAMAVGGLAGLAVAERERPAPDPWLAQALMGLRGGDLQRALFAVEQRLGVAPDDAAALVLEKRITTELECERTMGQAEHALANGDSARAARAFKRVGAACRQHPFAATQLEQIAAQ